MKVKSVSGQNWYMQLDWLVLWYHILLARVVLTFSLYLARVCMYVHHHVIMSFRQRFDYLPFYASVVFKLDQPSVLNGLYRDVSAVR